MLQSITSKPVLPLVLAALASLLLQAPCASSAAAQGTTLKVGPLVTTAPEGWQILDIGQIEWLLEQERFPHRREFALSGPEGAVIYATYGEYPENSITAQGINRLPVPSVLTGEWGLDPAKVSSRVEPLSPGLEGVVLMASGPGSGRDFVTRKDVPTVAARVDIPFIYRTDGGPATSTISTLFFRAPKAVADRGELRRFQEMVTSLRLQESSSFATIADFDSERMARYVAESADVPTAPTVTAPAPAVTAAMPVVTTPAPSSLSAWVDALSSLDAAAKLPAAERAARLEPVASALRANPFLDEKVGSLRAAVSESAWVGQFLSDDPDGAKAESLRGLHRAILDRVRDESGLEGVNAYLRYLSQVWQDHRLAEPPSGASKGDRWTNPYLGLEMVRVTPPEGDPFWISSSPLLEFLSGRALVDWKLPNSPTRQEALDLAARLRASIPTQEEYRSWVSALNPRVSSRRRFWAARSGSDRRDPAVEIGTSVTSLWKRPGYRLKDGDFYLLLR